jgi:hypothetical protein
MSAINLRFHDEPWHSETTMRGVRRFQDAEQVAALDVEEDVLEPRHTLASAPVCPPV